MMHRSNGALRPGASRHLELVEFFRGVELFATLADEQLEELARISVNRVFPKDTIIFQQGDHADALYLIRRGKVKVLLATAEGQEVIVSVLGIQNWFGEMAMIDSDTRCARVEAMTVCHLTLIPKHAFDQLLDNSPRLAVALLSSLVNRLRAANRNIGSLAAMDVSGRVARVLLDLAEPSGETWVVRDMPTQKEIANMVGATREMVNRVIKGFINDGYISMRGKELMIHEQRAPEMDFLK